MKKQLKKYKCDYHSQHKISNNGRKWEDLLKGRPKSLIEGTCFDAVEDEYLTKGVGKTRTIPRFIPWKCICGKCNDCGIDRNLKVSECPILINCNKKTKCMMWEHVNIPKSTNKQWELLQKLLPVRDIIRLMLEELKKQGFIMLRTVGLITHEHCTK